MTLRSLVPLFALSLLLSACSGGSSSDAPAPSTSPVAPPKVAPQSSATEPAAEVVESAPADEASTPPQPVNLAATGQALFGECAVCHQVDPTKGHRIGPNLYGVYGAPAARHADFRYSRALQNSGIAWNDEELDGYLENPNTYVRGGRMAYRGQKDPQKRAALIAYMKTLTDAPATESAQ